VQEERRGVHELHGQVELLDEAAPHLRRLVQAEHAIIDEDAREPIANRAVNQHGRH
jgi:hypothetical protein